MGSVTVTRTTRTPAEVLDGCRAQVEPALRAAVDTLPGPVRAIAAYHFGWRAADGRPSSDGAGKAVRPALALLCAEAVGGERAAAVPAAVAVELVHNFSLLHDDVMDGDRTRRHRPTAWTVFGTSAAVLAGDALLALAMDVIAADGAGAVRGLGAAVQELVDGQVADLAFEGRGHVALAECLGMAAAKTGALLGAACGLGAAAGGAPAAEVARLDRFGRDLGLAFQLVDDLLGIWGDPATTGKPVRNDLRSRKKSLPVVVALTSGTAAGRELAALYGAGGVPDGEQLDREARLVEVAGGRAWCRRRAEVLLGGALDLLPGSAPPHTAADLRALAGLLARRTR